MRGVVYPEIYFSISPLYQAIQGFKDNPIWSGAGEGARTLDLSPGVLLGAGDLSAEGEPASICVWQGGCPLRQASAR